MNKNILMKLSSVQVLLLALAIVLTYGHTLDVPFYLDDFSSIQENPIIFDWQGTLAELWQFSALRIVGYFSFALNYQVHQFQVAGYHVINILIHFLTSTDICTPSLANSGSHLYCTKARFISSPILYRYYGEFYPGAFNGKLETAYFLDISLYPIRITRIFDAY